MDIKKQKMDIKRKNSPRPLSLLSPGELLNHYISFEEGIIIEKKNSLFCSFII